MLAFMAIGVIGLSLVTIAVLLIAYAMGATSLPVLLPLLPFIGLPIGMVLIIALAIVGANRRKREGN
ncbi:unannotated protein [freshwater metagenome]|uniref:Unannotated protein n=1 Tax=freshwater metagenome TaxID=449393 RepID=A0A6J6AZJ8_9ZZZZ